MIKPEWMTSEGEAMLKATYLQENETIEDMYDRLAHTAAKYFGPDLYAVMKASFSKILWNGWLCPSTPVLTNFGTTRGLPISCFGSEPESDSLDAIFDQATELARLSKAGGGTAVNISKLRPRGSKITNNGYSDGVTSWCKLYDTTISVVSQGSTRRGSTALYLDVHHKDIEDFLRIRRPEGDINRQCLNINHGVSIDDSFMEAVEYGDERSRRIWIEIVKTRLETGEPYIFFKDNANKHLPYIPGKQDYKVSMSNLCSEIMLHTDSDHIFVCCLSSLNLAKYDEWKDTNTVELSIMFLDAVMQEFIDKAKLLKGFERAVRFAQASRALGLGVLGWHTLLQKKQLAFGSRESARLNNEIFKKIKKEATQASEQMAKLFGEPDWLIGSGRRNTHVTAIAPTFSNSIISGFNSAGIEPIAANAYLHRTAAGSFVKRNAQLLELNKLTEDDWKSVVENKGSVQQLNCLTDQEKAVFLTAREINQFDIINQAATRQQHIDQGQSLNLFCYAETPPKLLSQLHFEAWKLGIKSLYYLRSSSVLKGDMATKTFTKECAACEA